MRRKTNKETIDQMLLKFGSLDNDLAVAIPALVSSRKQSISVIGKSLLRDALSRVSDLPPKYKQMFA